MIAVWERSDRLAHISVLSKAQHAARAPPPTLKAMRFRAEHVAQWFVSLAVRQLRADGASSTTSLVLRL